MWLWEGSLSLKQPCPCPSPVSSMSRRPGSQGGPCSPELCWELSKECSHSLSPIPIFLIFTFSLFKCYFFACSFESEMHSHVPKLKPQKRLSEITTFINLLCIFSNFST